MYIENNLWFDVAVMLCVFYLGELTFGHFEQHKPLWRRLLKTVIITAVVVWMSSMGLRVIAYSIVSAFGAFAVIYVHGYWLPKHGIHGWTGEPKEKYYELIGHKPRT